MQSINIPRFADGQRATVALQRECEPVFTHEVRELVQAQCCLHRKKKVPHCRAGLLVETTGLEPVTPCMSSKYSDQLSYASVINKL